MTREELVRVIDAIAIFEERARTSSATLLEAQSRLLTAVDAAQSFVASTAEVINLTRALKLYTIVLAAIGVVQIALMLWKR